MIFFSYHGLSTAEEDFSLPEKNINKVHKKKETLQRSLSQTVDDTQV